MPPPFVVLSTTVLQNYTFVLLLSSRYVYGGFYLVDYSPCLLMFRCTILVLIDFKRCFLIRFYVRPGKFFRRPCLIAFMSLSVFGMKSAT